VGKPAKIVDKAAAAEKKVIPNAKPAGTAAAPAAPAGATKPASVKEDDTRVSAGRGNRRDPFVSPIVKASAGGGPACETGKRCLMVDQIELKGIVKSPSGYIAVVENAARRAYFLRENDPVFNGSVVKITGDTIIFREQVVDKLGKQSMREVTKKVNAPAV
jgi:Tfp pilus assembly protein PilP